MKRSVYTRWITAAVLTITAAIVLSSFAVAQYDDDRYYQGGSSQQAHQYGYQSGYRDGYRKGQHEGRENDPGDINIGALQDATHGYQQWMGPLRHFRHGYRDGYRKGFRSGYQAVNRGWEHSDDDAGGYYPGSVYNDGPQ